MHETPPDHLSDTDLPRSPMADWRLGQMVYDTYHLSKLGGFLYLFGWA